MHKKKFCKRAQSLAEYAVIISAVAAAVGAMGIFFRAGLQNHLRRLAMQLELDGRAYAPRMTNSYSQGSATSIINETYSKGVTNVTFSESTQRSGTQQVSFERD